MTSTARLRPTKKVWQGVLIMWRHPYLIEHIKKDHKDWKMSKAQLKEWGIKQHQIDAVLRAIDWATSNETKEASQ